MIWIEQILRVAAKPFQWWITIAPWEQGVRVRLGKRLCELGPGVHLRIPLADRIYVQSTRVRIVSTNNQTVSTMDGKVVTLHLAVRFSIGSVLEVYQSVSDPGVTVLNAVMSWASEHVSTTHSDSLTHRSLESFIDDRARSCEWGLTNLSAKVLGFAFVRTYRLLVHDYERSYGLDLESKDYGGLR